MKVAIVGVTGLVGREFLKVLEETSFPITDLIPVASERSSGSEIYFNGNPILVKNIQYLFENLPDIAFFSAGSSVSLEFGRKLADLGVLVIDNSSAWRMDPEVPLIVPEVNIESGFGKKLIANPNCSTIQLVTAVYPLHQAFGLRRLHISTYQAVSGTGQKALAQLKAEKSGIFPEDGPYAYPIEGNVIPQCDIFLENGYTHEEMKLVNESRKIMELPNLSVSATAVRVPVVTGHSESVYCEFESPINETEVRKVLSEAPGVILQDEPKFQKYPMPINAIGKNDVFVGRIRRDLNYPNGLHLWIVADNLRKGAAGNAVQIALNLAF